MLLTLLFGVIVLARGQSGSLELVPGSFSPSSFNMTTYTAGSQPDNPMVNYTGQVIKYKWSWFGGEGISANIYVYSSASIPSGFTFTIEASSSSSPSTQGPGSSTGPVTLSTYQQTLVSGIWNTASGWFGSAKVVSRTLTSNLTVTDFSQLHPGTYPITVNFLLQ